MRHVMNDATIPRLDLDGLDPFVLVEIGFDDNILVGHCAGGFDWHRLRELEDGIRLADEPALRKCRGLRGVALVACLPAAIDPGKQVLLLGGGQ